MTPTNYTGLGRMLYDWQTIIAGVLALVAGIMAYAVGRKQVTAVRIGRT
jgi:hypothetical protein